MVTTFLLSLNFPSDSLIPNKDPSEPKPEETHWKQIKSNGDVPASRSGHTLTWTGGYSYVLYGGIEDFKKGSTKIQPNNELYVMKMSTNEAQWTKEQASGSQKPPARAQHIAISTHDHKKLFVFGGHQNPQKRLNCSWYLHTQTYEWEKIWTENVAGQESGQEVPAPRANTGASMMGKKIYVFGGHGGLNYARVAFNDIYCFDTETNLWEKIEPNNNPPEPRGGHSVFCESNKIYVYGGWNSESQYCNTIMFDLETKLWSDPDIFNGIPRWNHCSIMVEAIPSWKYFIFGGESADFNEGAARHFGHYVNSTCFLDMDPANMKWTTIASDPETQPLIPAEREYSSMTYDHKDSRLIVFGGWNNGWFNDLYALNVKKIVGPSYAITSIDPCLGQLSGNVPITITGVGFKEATISVFFTQGSSPVDQPTKQTLVVSGQFENETTITCMSPSFESFGPKPAVVQLALTGSDLTTTWQTFTFFMNTRAYKSLCYGPGLSNGMAVGVPITFIIQARNDMGENRQSGRDNFEIRITKAGTQETIDAELKDCDNGQYHVTYQVEEQCDLRIEARFQDDKGNFVHIRGSPYSVSFNADNHNAKDNNLNSQMMQKLFNTQLEEWHNYMTNTVKGAQQKKDELKDVNKLIQVKDHIESVFNRNDEITLKLDQLDETVKMFQAHNSAKDSQVKSVKKLFDEWTHLKKVAREVKREITPLIEQETSNTTQQIRKLEDDIKNFNAELKKRDFYQYKCGVDIAKEKLDLVYGEMDDFNQRITDYGFQSQKFGNGGMIDNSVKSVETIKTEIGYMKILWDHIAFCKENFNRYMETKWIESDPMTMEDEVKKFLKTLKDMKVDKRCNAYVGLLDEIKKWLIFLPLVQELRSDSMRPSHWEMIQEKCGVKFEVNDSLLVKNIYELNLVSIQEDVEEITDQAKQEARMEKTLAKLEENWKDIKFEFTPHKGTDVKIMKLSEENFEMLEENQTQVTAMFSNRYLATFETKVVYWQKALFAISEIFALLLDVQRVWNFLENLFIHSEEVKKELPEVAAKFIGIDKDVKAILKDGEEKQKAVDFCIQDHVLKDLENVQKQLTVCEKALNDFMDKKKKAFPRFYFVSPADLLDILSNGNAPAKIMVHMPKIFNAVETLTLKEGDQPIATGIVSCVGIETVKYSHDLHLKGKVEKYLQDVIDMIIQSLRDITNNSLDFYLNNSKDEWLERDPAQCTLLVNLVIWVKTVEEGFAKIPSDKDAVKKAYQTQVDSLTQLIQKVLGKLDKPLRQKIMCLITMDAHSRDITDKLYQEGVTKDDEFQWQSQLKAYPEDRPYDDGTGNFPDFKLKISDARFWYGYEYLGNGPRLVITPLTDRIYVTACQSLHLKMGCAPAGPAGTGKTETTKDLASAMGKAVYVFNCSDQMDYKSMAGIFKGIASSGSWVCFDEFNRLVPEVLSVCTVQFKSVTDAIRNGQKRFIIQDDEIDLDPTCGAYITMNPGYLGRSELPEGLKALFRPITVVVPDLELICENMLMAEGFIEAKILAKKFTTLYMLCKDLLSKADHYDWGLRAIKSVLVVAGSFKRAEPDLLEQAILMRALRDFNTPKIVAQDLDIFMYLLNDLFPGINVERSRDMEFEGIIKQATEQQLLFPDPQFILKVVQLKELLAIRHCVFVMGPPGAGKSSTWRTLEKAQNMAGIKTSYKDLNPKVVSTNELYGVVHIQTREWIDGLLSCTMRSLGQIPDTNPKWIILDGDLDANWIESMNSVMDDNKILTLASNERIVLKSHMKMIFEIRDLAYATPATVSRAGILYISDNDGYQWRAYVKSWIMTKKYTDEIKVQLQGMFDKYIPDTLLHCKKSFDYIVPQVEICLIVSICKLLESIMATTEVVGLEYIFVFCCVWCIGGGYAEKDNRDYRKEFSNWWKDRWKTIKFPAKGTVFDYFVEQTRLVEWDTLKTKDVENSIDTSKSISNYTVPTVDTISAQYLMRLFIGVGHSPLLVGKAGCGKTQIIKGLLNDLTTTTEDYLQQIINFNYYTDSTALQASLEQLLEKKAGRNFGPVGKYKLIYFIDDINMPMLDPYNTQTAIALVRQHKDYNHWYERSDKFLLVEVQNTLYVASMNPSAGSFYVNQRLQRHFWMLAVSFPANGSLISIYSAYLIKHFGKFHGAVQELVPQVIKTALTLHGEVERTFRKTAKDFHYEFNVRHLTNIFQGILQARTEAIKTPDSLVKLWCHESERIYGDRLVNAADLAKYRHIVQDLSKKNFPKQNLSKYFGDKGAEPLIFANFVAGLDEKLYDQFQNIEQLSERLQFALREYNDLYAAMDLVLFDDAMKHCCKISRIIAADQGHALLVGVGGSGKQSLSMLSCFICSYTKTGILISSTYSINDLKTDLQGFYQKAGVKDEGLMFLFTEGQITNERFLVYINDLLSSGEIADLFAPEDIDGIVAAITPACKGEGIPPTKDNCYKFFIDRVKKNLHMSICFSPVGDGFRNRAKKFPAIINNTVIDYFHPWPQDALLSVAAKFLADVEMASDEIRTAVENFMPFSFDIVNKISGRILIEERRYIYTTPKSFLELIKLFKVMLGKKETELQNNKDRYETGVIKLNETGEIVAKLEEELKVKSVEVAEKSKLADEQAEIVGKEKVKVEAESAKAAIEADKCAVIKREVESESKQVKAELAQALPLVEAAMEALKVLNVKDFQVMKAFQKPPPDIEKVFICVLNLFAGIDPVVEVDKNKRFKSENPWKNALKLMGKPEAFLQQLEGFKDQIDADKVKAYNFTANAATLKDENFTPEIIKTKSSAAGNLCFWIINITKYYEVVVTVEPKKAAVKKAEETLAAANVKKAEVDAQVAELSEKLAKLQAEYQAAMDEKNAAEAEAARCMKRLDNAQRLVNALGSESDRWNQAIVDLANDLTLIVGDVLLAASFVSYVGPFNKKYRDIIMEENFIQFFQKNNIPHSPSANPLVILTDDAQVAEWNNQKLPSDKVSTENGAILTNSERYSLIIDPQLQGIQWLKQKEAENELQVTRLSNPKIIKTIEFAIENGQSVLIENLLNSIDAVLAPVYGRAVIKKGKNKYIELGGQQLSLNPNFKLFMHTKLSNPHYPPEIQAECTLINFTVTEDGLEDQLLALVVKKERPDLAKASEELIQQQNEFKIKLKTLEKDLLHKLTTAEGDILENIELIENLEYSKKLSIEINEKVAVAKETEVMIKEASEYYRPAASRGALVFFLMNDLAKMHSFYKFSLDSFIIVIKRAIDIVAESMKPKKEAAEGDGDGEGEGDGEKEDNDGDDKDEGEDGEEKNSLELSPRTLAKRVDALIESITFQAFNYTRRGTFEMHKLCVATMLCFKIMVKKGLINQNEVDSLIKKEVALDPPHQADSLKFIPESIWPSVKGLEVVKTFENLVSNMENEALQWRKWYQEEKAETADLPKSFNNCSLFHRLLLLRSIRPDRLSGALTEFVSTNLGIEYIEAPAFDIFSTYKETSPVTPIFFVLFPGVDPTPEVEAIGRQNGKLMSDGTFINISMGQGQEEIAARCLTDAGKTGKWIMLQNVHLMQTWMKSFERQLEIVIENDVHPEFRCFVSSEPPPMILPLMEIIPESILQNSIKVANEAPSDLKSNLRRAFSKFPEEHFKRAEGHKLNEFKALLFGLCMFHSLILGRKKFGSQGWSRNYNFNDGDLTICGDVLHNYLSNYDFVPYNDIRYIFGEIMYGGHITDHWDRRTNNTYLQVLVRPEILNQMQLTLAPGFKSPPVEKFDREAYRKYIEERLPVEIPQMFGLHPNAEIGYLTTKGETLFDTIQMVSGGGGKAGGSEEDTVKMFINKFLETCPENFNLIDMEMRVTDKTPYVIVCLQECERMNKLLNKIKVSLTELDMGLKGQLNITDAMEKLAASLKLNKLDDGWAKVAYFSKKSLTVWFDDMIQRCAQLDEWQSELVAPKVVWISGLFNPMSYLTAIMQVTSREKGLALDYMTLETTVLNTKDTADIANAAEDGAYINGFFLEGAGWEPGRGNEQGYLTDMVLKDLHPELPIMHVKSLPVAERKTLGFYECPIFITTMRGPTYVTTAWLQMESEESDPKKWILAGVALLMSAE